MFEDFLNRHSSWLSGKGPEAEIVFSSRIRLARNLAGVPFPSRATQAERRKVVDVVEIQLANTVDRKVIYFDATAFLLDD